MQERKILPSGSIEDETEDEEREIDEDQSEEEYAEARQIDGNRKEKDGEAGRRENEDEQGNQQNGQIGECAICRVIVNDANLGGSIADSKQNPRSAEGYLLCQRCVRKFSIRSGQRNSVILTKYYYTYRDNAIINSRSRSFAD